jgi:hypothetical protein
MQSISIFKPIETKTYCEEELKNIKTKRKEMINDCEEELEFQMFFNEQIDDYIRCHIRMDEPFAIKGRVLQTEISEIIITQTYDAFLNIKNGIFFILANKKSAELINQQFNEKLDVNNKKLMIDLQDIIEESTNVKRTQFRGLRIETIHGSSLSGNRITDTELYRTMLEAGELSTIAVSYPINGEDINFSISDSGSIVLFSTLTVEEILEFLNTLVHEKLS